MICNVQQSQADTVSPSEQAFSSLIGAFKFDVEKLYLQMLDKDILIPPLLIVIDTLQVYRVYQKNCALKKFNNVFNL